MVNEDQSRGLKRYLEPEIGFLKTWKNEKMVNFQRKSYSSILEPE